MARYKLVFAFIVAFALPTILLGAENLVLNPRLNYKRNNHQGPLITGDRMMEGVKPGMVNYIVFYEEFCYNAKRQARTTVELYHEYKGRIHFVTVDFEYGWSSVQDKLVRNYFMSDGNRDFPQIVILDRKGRPVFDYIGQTPQPLLEKWLNAALAHPQNLAAVMHPMDTPGKIPNRASTTVTSR